MGRERAPPKQLKDYKVYVAIEEKDKFMLTTCADNDVKSSDKNNDRALEAVAPYIMVHYKEKEKPRRERRNIGPRLGNTVLMLGFVISVIEQRQQSQRSCINFVDCSKSAVADKRLFLALMAVGKKSEYSLAKPEYAT